MNEIDQDTDADFNAIAEEWRRLEIERRALETRFDVWRRQLLETADRMGLGEAIRRRNRPPPSA
jgi:2-polyprenyl-3-methyl-5-hydroxy-6-metoxy-1,4-benzoquinol methylase